MSAAAATRRAAAPARRAGRVAALLSLLGLVVLTGCASIPEPRAIPLPIPGEIVTRTDPWEPFNRRMFAFNEVVDKAVLKPAAQAYQAVVPELARSGINHVLGNLGDAWSTVNLFLQVKPRAALEMGMRTLVNTVFGLGGLLDVADELGLQRSTTEDLGQTLGVWGIPSGPYVVLPVLGPSTVRDGITSLAVDRQHNGPAQVLREPRDRNAASVLQVLDTRVNLLNAGRVLDDIALDKYVLLRDAYLSRRRSLIYDGDPPDDPPPANPDAAAPGPAAGASAPAGKASAPAAAASAAAK